MANPRVVIIGAGFGGLYAARKLANKPVDVLLIDRNNYHTFTPLMYQVATCGLDPSEVAYPVRSIFAKNQNVNFLLANVTAIDHQARTVSVESGGHQRSESYDYLILAAGSVPAYFGKDDIQKHSFPLRTLRDSVSLRNHVLKLFERAAWLDDHSQRAALTTLVVVGGGPTGLETAGAIHELYNHVLDKEYGRYGEDMRARVILVELLPHLLPPYPERLRAAALRQLRSLGVEVMLETSVETAAEDHVTLSDGSTIPTYTVIWLAGVRGSPLAEMLAVELTQNGRIPIEATCQVTGRERVFAVGDSVYLENAEGVPYPMLIPVAQQQGVLAARNILRQINGEPLETFKYNDRGIMATIGRSRAVVWLFNRLPLTGFVAWLAWLAFHLITLMGFRNRANVFVNWVWNYITYDRSVRIILEPDHTHDLP
jgi:NADH dehydrogenase